MNKADCRNLPRNKKEELGFLILKVYFQQLKEESDTVGLFSLNQILHRDGIFTLETSKLKKISFPYNDKVQFFNVYFGIFELSPEKGEKAVSNIFSIDPEDSKSLFQALVNYVDSSLKENKNTFQFLNFLFLAKNLFPFTFKVFPPKSNHVQFLRYLFSFYMVTKNLKVPLSPKEAFQACKGTFEY